MIKRIRRTCSTRVWYLCALITDHVLVKEVVLAGARALHRWLAARPSPPALKATHSKEEKLHWHIGLAPPCTAPFWLWRSVANVFIQMKVCGVMQVDINRKTSLLLWAAFIGSSHFCVFILSCSCDGEYSVWRQSQCCVWKKSSNGHIRGGQRSDSSQ